MSAQANKRRVVVTGAGVVSPIGNNWQTVRRALETGACGLQIMNDWQDIDGLRGHIGGPCEFALPKRFGRRATRSMGRVAQLAVTATEDAVIQSGIDESHLTGGRLGVAYGSATGSPDALLEFVSIVRDRNISALKATSYLRSMGHTAAVNIAVTYGITGRTLTTSSACTASSQAIGFALEAIRSGAQDMMLAGGADELTATHSAVFDALLATSTRNDEPSKAIRPFDSSRDGLALGEGACTLLLEELEHAQSRGALILGEVIGFATNTDGAHITAPNQATQTRCMEMALDDAGIEAAQVDYVSAHGTATDNGDISEARATLAALGPVAIASMKGHVGHSLGACGSLEAWACFNMLADGWLAPTLNLNSIDPACEGLDYIRKAGRSVSAEIIMSNNFAFGGINTSLLLRRWR
ncbi:MAG: beta-ketoacyl-ACP synthase [Pseudomonadaceae bacterium]|nr:beta-ketoacyl-ACP synthase [Pseudomonadaceae bacterium]